MNNNDSGTGTPLPDARRENRRLLSAMAVIIVIVAVMAIIGFLFLKPPADIIEGTAEATSVRVSGKLPGRVVDFYVREGDMVRRGDTLVHISSSLAEAKLEQAEGMQSAAEATSSRVDAGTRSQVINSAYQMWQQAKAALTIARKTYDRMESLYTQGVVSEQKRDEARAACEAAEAAEAAAHSQYELAKDGPQAQDRRGAAAMVDVARGGVAEVNALLEDRYLTAPCDGQVDVIFPNQGELVAMGAPIMNILRTDDKWVTFNVREDYLSDLAIGDTIDIMIPALDMLETRATVYYIRDMGTYAVWRATKATGDWDSRTFQVKARPLGPVDNLRPGMTVIYNHD